MAKRPKKKAEPGWYPDEKDPTLLRRWTGRAWTDERKPAVPERSVPAWLPPLIIAVVTLVVIVLGLVIALGDVFSVSG